jgi:ABC-type iron transport system FetAB permease component
MGFRFVQPSYITGMMVSGASPIYAGIYQFIIVAMILATWRSCQST